jgi:hypothetical protein
VTGEYVYWLGPDSVTCAACNCDGDCGAVWSVPRAKMDEQPRMVARSGTWKTLHGLAADKDYVYFTVSEDASSLLLRKPRR